MVEVICDTVFIIHLATTRIRNIDSLERDIGPVTFVVPEVAITELYKLLKDSKKKQKAQAALNYTKKLKKVPIPGDYGDDALVEYVAKNKSIVATMDRGLKKRIWGIGGDTVSVFNNEIRLDPRKS